MFSKKILKNKTLVLILGLAMLVTIIGPTPLSRAQSNSGPELTAATIAGSTGTQYVGTSSSAAKRTVAWTRTAYTGAVNIYYAHNADIAGGCASPDPADSDWQVTSGVNLVGSTFVWAGAEIGGLPAGTDYCLLVRSAVDATPWSVTDQFEIDNTVPAISTRQTQDLDGDGKIDAMKITFSDEVDDTFVTAGNFDIDGYNGEAFSSTTNGDVADDTVIYITFTEGSADSGALPTVTYAAGTLTDLADNALANNGPTASTDLAKPVITVANWLDSDTNGNIDRVTLTFSEQVDIADAGAGGDGLDSIVISDGSTLAIDSAAYAASDTTTLTLNFADHTGTASSSLSVTYSTAGDDAITDNATGTPNEILNGDVAELYTDGALPVFLSSTTADLDGNGTVDQVTIIYSEPVTIVDVGAGFDGVAIASCTVADADYSGVATTTSTLALTGCSAGNTAITADPTYTSATGSISDTANEMVNAETVTGTDNAAPAMLSSLGSDSDDDGKTNAYVITFSENLTNKDAAAANAKFTAKNATTDGAITIDTVGIGLTAGGGANKVTLNLDDADSDNYTGIIKFSYNSANGGAVVEDASAATNDYTNQTNVSLTDNVKPVLLSARGANVGGDADVVNFAGEFLEFTFSETMNAVAPSLANLEEGLLFANGATDGTNLSTNGTVARVTRNIAGDTYRVTYNSTNSINLITPATDTVAVALGTNIKDTTDVVANTTPAAVTIASADITPPSFTSRETQDLDGDGKIDAIKITMQESIVDSTINIANFTTDHNPGFGLASTTTGTYDSLAWVTGVATDSADDAVFYLKLVENATADTGAVPTLTYTAGTLADASGNTTVTSAEATTDKAAPVALSAVYKDTGTANGVVDSVDITLSEDVTVTTPIIAGWTVAAAGTINLVRGGTAENADIARLSAGVLRWKDASAETDFNGAANTTGGASNPTITYAKGVGSIKDSNNNELANFTALAATDGAAPFYVSSQTLDNDNNGTVDYVKVVYSESVLDSTVAETDFETGTDASTDALLLETFASLTPSSGNVTDTANDATIYIGVTSGTQTLTASTTNFTLHIIQDGAITDALSNSLASFTDKTSTDGAAPMIKTVTIADAASADGLIDSVTFTWSENVDTNDGVPPVFGDLPTTLLPDGSTAVFNDAVIGDPAGSSAIVTATGVTGQVTANTAVGATAISGDLSTMWTDGTIAAHIAGATANESIVDNAKPVFKSSTTADNDLNGTVDQATIIYSENVAITDAADGAFDGVTFANSCVAAAANYSSAGTNTSVVTLTSCTAGDTTITANPTYDSGTGAIVDLATALEMANAETVTGTDGAAPAVLTITAEDTDANGKLNRVSMTFSESLANTAVGANGFDVTTTGSHGTCDTESANPDETAALVLTFTCSGNDTSITNLSVGLTANAGVRDATNQTASKAFTSASSPALTDSAAPIPLSATITKAVSNGNLQNGSIIEMTFSEPVVPGAIANGNWKFSRNYSESLSSANWPDSATVAYAAGSTPSKVKMTLSAATASGAWGTVVQLNLNADNTATITDTSSSLNLADKNASDISISGMVGPVLNSEPVVTATSTGADISWTTNSNSTANEVKYGTTVAVESSSTAGTPGEGGTTHSINLSSLSVSTLYYYQVCFTNVSQTCTTINHFTTTAAADVEHPTVSSQTPDDEDTGVSIGVVPTITFSEDMDMSTLNTTNVQLRKVSDNSVITSTIHLVNGQRVAWIYTEDLLAYNTGYYLYVGTGVQDTSSNALEVAYGSGTATNFTTETTDTTAPTADSQTPVNGATNQAITVLPTVTFSENMATSTVNTTNVQLRAGDGDAVIASTVTYANKVATIHPSASLANNTAYWLWISGAQDVALNYMTASTTEANHTFTTAALADGTLALTIPIVASSTRTYATAGGDYAQGWAWDFYITVPTTETSFQIKFSDWTGSASTMATANNMQFYSAQASASSTPATAGAITAANTYSTIMTLDGELTAAQAAAVGIADPATLAGRQIRVTVETKVPTGTAGGSFSTSYQIHSQ